MAHGNGFVYRPTRRGRKLNVWYYTIRLGRRLKTGTGFETRKAAEDALKLERGRKARGKILAPEVERLLVEDVLGGYVSDLRGREAKSLRSVECRVNLLKEKLGHIRAMDLSVGDVEQYREERLAAGRNKATIDREVEIARASYRLAFKQRRVVEVPFFGMYNVDNVRQGFFDPQQTEAIIRAMPDEPTKEIVRFVSLAGWRIEEVLNLRWESVDVKGRQVRLGTSKNGRPRALALAGELLNLIERRWRAREYRTVAGSALSAFVFHRRRGCPVSYASYRRAFVKACAAAGVTDRTTHDFRRTVARDLRLEGIDETVCMSITGHATTNMFRRYAGIIDPTEQESALLAREARLQRTGNSNVMPMQAATPKG